MGRLKNTIHLHAYHAADAIYAPTHWQRSRIPEPYRTRAAVIFDGTDTNLVKPDPNAIVRLCKSGLAFRPGDEVISFVNRNLEPYRGFHVFMRALPDILRRRPQAQRPLREQARQTVVERHDLKRVCLLGLLRLIEGL